MPPSGLPTLVGIPATHAVRHTPVPTPMPVWDVGVMSRQASDSHLDLMRAPYVLYGVNYIDLVSLWRRCHVSPGQYTLT